MYVGRAFRRALSGEPSKRLMRPYLFHEVPLNVLVQSLGKRRWEPLDLTCVDRDLHFGRVVVRYSTTVNP
jgi:hypothetical protein